MKNILGTIAIILTFLGYIPYFKDIVKGKTKPHLYSWFLWGFVALIVFALQVGGGAGIGAFVTLAAVVMCAAVIVLGLKFDSEKDIKRVDTIFLIMALMTVGIWLIAKQPVLSTILITTIDLLGFFPTVRKSWIKPYSETLIFYWLNTLRFGLAILSLQQYSIMTALYPAIWFMTNGLFASMLIFRRQQLGVEDKEENFNQKNENNKELIKEKKDNINQVETETGEEKGERDFAWLLSLGIGLFFVVIIIFLLGKKY